MFRIEYLGKDKKNIKMTPLENSSSTPLEVPLEEEIFENLTYLEEDSNALEKCENLSNKIFGEPLLVLTRQSPIRISKRTNKRADIIALDKDLNGVIIELKKDTAKLGVETQALQYLATLSNFEGEEFLDKITNDPRELAKVKEAVNAFIEQQSIEGMSISDINKQSRVILLANKFDEALLSMGEWLGRQITSFKCIQYSIYKADHSEFLSFSTYFERSSQDRFKFRVTKDRKSSFFRHNIGAERSTDHPGEIHGEEWWKYCLANKIVTTSYENSEGDVGERKLRQYIKGDKIFAIASGYGLIGYGEVQGDNTYRLIERGK